VASAQRFSGPSLDISVESQPLPALPHDRLVHIDDATLEGQTAHLQAGLCRRVASRPQIRTARQDSIRSSRSRRYELTEFTCRRSDLCGHLL